MTTFKNEPINNPDTSAIGMTAPGVTSIVMLPPKTLSNNHQARRMTGSPATQHESDPRP